jgi:hypothetical protein
MLFCDIMLISVDSYSDDNLFFESFLNTKILQTLLKSYEKEKIFSVLCSIEFQSPESDGQYVAIEKEIVYPIMDINKIEMNFNSQYLKKKPSFKFKEILIRIQCLEPNFINARDGEKENK